MAILYSIVILVFILRAHHRVQVLAFFATNVSTRLREKFNSTRLTIPNCFKPHQPLICRLNIDAIIAKSVHFFLYILLLFTLFFFFFCLSLMYILTLSVPVSFFTASNVDLGGGYSLICFSHFSIYC